MRGVCKNKLLTAQCDEEVSDFASLVTSLICGALILTLRSSPTLTYIGVKHLLISNQQQTDLKQSYVNRGTGAQYARTPRPRELSDLLNSIQKGNDANVLVQTHGISGWRARIRRPTLSTSKKRRSRTVAAGHATEQTLDHAKGRIINAVRGGASRYRSVEDSGSSRSSKLDSCSTTHCDSWAWS